LILRFELREFEFTTEEVSRIELDFRTSLKKIPTIMKFAVSIYGLTAASSEVFGLTSDKVSQIPVLSSLRRFIRVRLFLCPEFQRAMKLKSDV
jgi:hypothetical protein